MKTNAKSEEKKFQAAGGLFKSRAGKGCSPGKEKIVIDQKHTRKGGGTRCPRRGESLLTIMLRNAYSEPNWKDQSRKKERFGREGLVSRRKKFTENTSGQV